MTNADMIRNMSDEELVNLLVWRSYACGYVPTCDEGCMDFGGGCANDCPHEKQEKAVREWLASESK